MRLPDAVETVFLVLTIFFSFYWSNHSYLSKFTLQLTALLILVFVFHNWLARKRQNKDSIQIYQSITNVLIVTLIAVSLVLATGGAGSMLFWLLDFLLFFVAVFFRAGAAFTLSLAIGLAFLLNEPQLAQTQTVNLVSLLLMAPLASFFSTQYNRLITAKNEIKILSNQAESLEQSTLIWLSLEFRNKLLQAIDLVSQISANLSRIPPHEQEKLNSLYQDLKALWQSGQDLGKKVDKITEE